MLADSFQVLTLISGYERVPDRQAVPRLEIQRVNMASPLWLDIAAGTASGTGVGGTVIWLFRYAVTNPGEIGSWWNNVKIGRERSRQELQAVKSEAGGNALVRTSSSLSAADAAGEALRLANEASAQLPELVRQLPIEPQPRRPRPGPTNSDFRYNPGAPPIIQDETSLFRPSVPTEDIPELVIDRWRNDAGRLRRVAGPPDVEAL